MPNSISAVAYALRVGSHALPKPFVHGHALQLTAAALGYKSLASLQTSQENPIDLSSVKHVVIANGLVMRRALELGYEYDEHAVMQVLRDSLRTALPATRVHWDEAAFADEMSEFLSEQISTSGHVSSALSESNGVLGEVQVSFEHALDEVPMGATTEFNIVGKILVSQNPERPYSGHVIHVNASLFLTRLGQVCFAMPECKVKAAQLQYYPVDDHDDEGPKVSLLQALVDELGVSAEEAQILADADISPNESNDGGIVYSYSLDAETVDLPRELRSKLVQQFGSLSIELPASFYDNVHWSPFD